MKVAILNNEQKSILDKSEISTSWKFHIIRDCNDNWVLTEGQINSSTLVENDWIKSLPLIDWCKPAEPDIQTLLGQ